MTLAKLALTLSIAALAGSALAAQPTAPPVAQQEANAQPWTEYKVENAALLYYRYWIIGKSLTSSQFFVDEYNTEPGWHPSAEFSLSLAAGQEAVKGILKASKIRQADWGVEYDEGIFALLPHLGKLRQSARLLSADARRLTVEGNSDGAAERIAALFRMGEQLDHDPVFISSLVGISIIARGNAEVEEIIAYNKLTAEARDIILEAMDAIDLDNPAGVRGAVLGERDIFLRWTLRRYTGPTAGADFVKEMFAYLDSSFTKPPPWTAMVSNYAEAKLQKDIHKAEKYYDDVLSIWDLPDAADRIDKLALLVESGYYGVAGRVLLPAMGKVWQNSQKIRRELIETRKLLENAPVIAKKDRDEGED